MPPPMRSRCMIFNGRFLYVNKKTFEIHGYEEAEFMALNLHEIDTPECAAFIEERMRLLSARGVASFEVEHLRKDSSVFPMEIFVKLVQWDREPAILGIWTDITERKQAEAALLDSEQKYRVLVENANSIILRMDNHGNVTFFNPFSERFFGFSEEEILGRNVVGTIIPESESTGRNLQEMLEGILKNPDRYRQNENENIGKDGRRVWVNWTNKGIYDADGNLIEILCIGNDITARKNAEEAIRREQEFSQLLLDTSPAFIVAIDPGGKVLMMNQSLLDALGYTNTEVIGTDYLSHFVPETDRKSVQAVFDRINKTKETSVNENRIISRSGEIFSVEWHGRPALRPDGTVEFFVGAGMDISERKKADEALRHRIAIETFMAEISARFINMSSKELAVAIDEALLRIGIIIGADRGYVFQMDESHETMSNTHEWCAPGIRPLIDELQNLSFTPFPWWMEKLRRLQPILISSVAEMPPEAEAEKQFLLHQVVQSLIVVPLSWQNELGGFIGFDVVRENRDWAPEDQQALRTLANTLALVFERKAADEAHEHVVNQLHQAQKMEAVGRLAGGIAHDFNNMLGVILGHTELAMLGLESSHPLFNSLNEIKKAGERSANLTRQLLAFARKQTINPQTIDLNETISGMLKMLERLIGEDIDLSLYPGDELWPVKMDPVQVDQILANLVVNSRDAIKGVGKITIETRNTVFDAEYCSHHTGFLPGEYVLLAVSDTGCGMDREILASIFELFFTTKPKGQGTGLGLATVYGIVKQNNGFINAYSELAQGTTFKIYIPRSRGENASYEPHAISPQLKTGSETVLLVEDEPAVLDLAKRLIEQLGYRVLMANGPREARKWVEEYPETIDLLLTDVVMPEMNGRDLWRELSALRPGMKCLFMSGYTEDAIAHHGILEEGVHFVPKPFSIETLAIRLREALSDD